MKLLLFTVGGKNVLRCYGIIDNEGWLTSALNHNYPAACRTVYSLPQYAFGLLQ